MMERIAITLSDGADLDGFRAAARQLIGGRVAPERVSWQTENTPSLFAADPASDPGLNGAPPINIPRAAADLIANVVCHRDPARYDVAYSLLWRMLNGEPALLERHHDPVVFRLAAMAKAVRRDLHKMHAFLRFRRVPDAADERYVAWFEPDHYIVEATADFFVKRFPSFAWSILTPVGSLYWDCDMLTVGPPGSKADAPTSDAMEEGWATYYASTFNPARVNTPAMQREMPKKYWRNMPEAKLIPDLVRSAGSRVETVMTKAPQASKKKEPERALAAMRDNAIRTLDDLNAVIRAADPFVPGGTRAVLGEGPLRPALAFVGEQPGDQEDLQGRPFVGPAGQLLMRAMEEAGIDRSRSYVTNAVKHFKYEQRGKRRLHKTPTAGEVRHYRWWLTRELEIVQPKVVVALGATAVLALNGKPLAITSHRGPAEFGDQHGFITVHPSYLLRLPDPGAKRDAYAAFVADLSRARQLAEQVQASAA